MRVIFCSTDLDMIRQHCHCWIPD